MNKGIILDVTENYFVMLTPDGEFVKGKKTNSEYNIGQEILFYPYSTETRKKRSILSFWPLAATFAAIMFISFVLLNPFSSNKAYAYVTMDMNPSIEFVLDKKLRVIDTNAYNEKGKDLLSKIDINRNETFSTVAKKVIEKCRALGYLAEKSNIVIASVAAEKSSKKLTDLEKEVENLKPVANKMEANIEVVKATPQDRQSAVKKGVSAGKFVIEKDKKTLNKNKTNSNEKINSLQQKPVEHRSSQSENLSNKDKKIKKEERKDILQNTDQDKKPLTMPKQEKQKDKKLPTKKNLIKNKKKTDDKNKRNINNEQDKHSKQSNKNEQKKDRKEEQKEKHKKKEYKEKKHINININHK